MPRPRHDPVPGKGKVIYLDTPAGRLLRKHRHEHDALSYLVNYGERHPITPKPQHPIVINPEVTHHTRPDLFPPPGFAWILYDESSVAPDLFDAIGDSWEPKPSRLRAAWVRSQFALAVLLLCAAFGYIVATVWAGPWPSEWPQAPRAFFGGVMLAGILYIAAQDR